MWILYTLALAPLFIGAILFVKYKQVVWWEWLLGSGISFLVAGVFHFVALKTELHDTETWSGQIERAVHYPFWVERYEIEHDIKDAKGNVTGHYTTTHYRDHDEYWEAETTLHTSFYIDESFYSQICMKFRTKGGKLHETEDGSKSGFHSGDKNIYPAYNRSSFVYPVTTTRSWDNRVKAAATVFNFAKVPTNIAVFPYPENRDVLASDRLKGTAANAVNLFKFDQMNARLGPYKKVNVILCGFGDQGPEIAQWQRAKWFGGKKNDLVLCYGGSEVKPSWAVVFGWTDAELVKKNLETILLENPVNDAILPLVEQEVGVNYRIKDWSKFDYITIYPPKWCYIAFIIVMIGVQISYYVFAFGNEYSKWGKSWGKFSEAATFGAYRCNRTPAFKPRTQREYTYR
jgi:hypothetical protein